MTMTANQVIVLSEVAAHLIGEDIQQAEDGRLKFVFEGKDMTSEHIQRNRAALSRLLEIIDGCGCHCI